MDAAGRLQIPRDYVEKLGMGRRVRVDLEDGRIVETSTVGNEGIIGIAAVLGLGFSPKTAATTRVDVKRIAYDSSKMAPLSSLAVI